MRQFREQSESIGFSESSRVPTCEGKNVEEPDQLVKSTCVEQYHIYSNFSLTFEEKSLSFDEGIP